ncbi:MAG: FixH family protein [Phycisphaerales bacterium]
MISTTPPPRKGFFRRGKHWPFVIVAMLLVHASLMIGTIAHVSSKGDTWVETDYYAKSVDWDNQRAMQEAAADMGWSVDLTTEHALAGTRLLRATITDSSGRPVEGALVEIQCVHPAQLNNRLSAVLHESPDGGYARVMEIDAPGFWKATLSIRHAGVDALVIREFEIN